MIYLISPDKKQYKANLHCHSADDNHNEHPEGNPNCDSFGAFTMIMPDEFSYNGITNAMEKGEMYSSMGPTNLIFDIVYRTKNSPTLC